MLLRKYKPPWDNPVRANADHARRLILYAPPMAVGGGLTTRDGTARMQTLIDAGEKEQALLLFLRDVLRLPNTSLWGRKPRPDGPQASPPRTQFRANVTFRSGDKGQRYIPSASLGYIG